MSGGPTRIVSLGADVPDSELAHDGPNGSLDLKAFARLAAMGAPGVVTLTDGATIATDASLGSIFSVTLAGNRTLSNPTNLKTGQWYTWLIVQDGTGNRTLAYGTAFDFGAATPYLNTTAAGVTVVYAIYDGTKLRAQSEVESIAAPIHTQLEIDGTSNPLYLPNGSVLAKLYTGISLAQTVSAAANVVGSANDIQEVTVTGGNVTLTSTPSITAGAAGQKLTVLNVGASNNLVIQDNGTLAGSKVFLGAVGTTVTVAPKGSATFVYSSTVNGGPGWVLTSHT